MSQEELLEKARAVRSLPSPALARAIREDRGLPQADFAQTLGVTPATISRWETGARSPRGRLLVAYVQLLEELRRV